MAKSLNGMSPYTQVCCKLRYLLACTNCDRTAIKNFENEVESYRQKCLNKEITHDEFDTLCEMMLKKIIIEHDYCKEIEWVN